MISDEVINGFGRTGKPFGFMNYDVQPDIITMAKGITSGYLPLSATAVKREIYEAFKSEETYGHFRHVNTFGGNPAACALAIRNLEIMEEEKLIDNSRNLGDWLLEELKQLLAHPNVGDVRGKGLLAGIEFVKDKESKEPLEEGKVAQIVADCKENGVIVGKTSDTVNGYNNIITLSPPLSISKDELQMVVETIKNAVAKL